MGFRNVDFSHLAKFNSAASSDFIDKYEEFIDSKIIAKAAEPSSKTFAPSSIRCLRKCWFRLRGTQPDKVLNPDRTLSFIADIGTACHRILQSNLKELLGNDWVDVKEYLASTQNTLPYKTYEVRTDDSGLETLVTIPELPIRFACDGIIKLNGNTYLLEIKTSEYGSWNDLTDPKSHHIAQIECYATLLNLENALVVYQDRQYGELKCYELHITPSVKDKVLDNFKIVKDAVESNIAPKGLPIGDSWCTPNMCPYYKKCQEYGR